jgi:serine palmitoyltransferase
LSKLEPSLLPALPTDSPSQKDKDKDRDAIISIPSHPASGLLHIFLMTPPPTMDEEERLLQEVVDECAVQGVLVTRARRLRGQETFEPEPSLKVCLSGGMTKKEVEKAGQVLRAALQKVCGSESNCFNPKWVC